MQRKAAPGAMLVEGIGLRGRPTPVPTQPPKRFSTSEQCSCRRQRPAGEGAVATTADLTPRPPLRSGEGENDNG